MRIHNTNVFDASLRLLCVSCTLCGAVLIRVDRTAHINNEVNYIWQYKW